MKSADEGFENVYLSVPVTEEDLAYAEAVTLWRAYWDAAEAFDRSRPHWPAPVNAYAGSLAVLPKDGRPGAPDPYPVEARVRDLVGTYVKSSRAMAEALEAHERALQPCTCESCTNTRDGRK